MNREDIIRMAEECGFSLMHSGIVKLWLANNTDLERFAELVASAEHKRVQQVYTDAATGSVKAAIAYEREACAKVCDEMWTGYGDCGAICSSAIRARGQA